MYKKILIGLAAFAVATSAVAQTKRPAKIPKPAFSEAKLDTLNMTCSEATAMVKNSQGVVLRTGSNRWDRYVHDGEACGSIQHDLAVQFVRTRDSRACHIGFTCEELPGAGE